MASTTFVDQTTKVLAAWLNDVNAWTYSGTFAGTSITLGGDVVLTRDAANTLALRNGSAAQTFNVYNTFTDAANFERLNIAWSANEAIIYASKGGTGTERNLVLGAGSAALWKIVPTGHFQAYADNVYDIGAFGATRPRTGYFGTSVVTSVIAAPTELEITAQTGNAIRFFTNYLAQEQFRVAHTASAVNYVQVTGAAAGNTPAISAQGSDAAVGLNITAKGTGPVRIQTGGGNQLVALDVANAVNYLQANGAATGNPVVFQANGADATINLVLRSQGATSQVRLDSNSNILFMAQGVASSVNYVQVQNNSTGNPAVLSAQGSDATVGLILQALAGDIIYFRTAAGVDQFRVLHTASANRYVTVTGSNGGNPTISTSGGGLGCAVDLVGQTSVLAWAATAIPAGGTAGRGFMLSSTANYGIFFGSGAPTLSAAKGSLYLRSDGTTNVTRMYVNTDGGTTWTAVNTVA